MSAPEKNTTTEANEVTIFESFIRTLPTDLQDTIRSAACLRPLKKRFDSKKYTPAQVVADPAYTGTTTSSFEELTGLIAKMEELAEKVPTPAEINQLRVGIDALFGRLNEKEILAHSTSGKSFSANPVNKNDAIPSANLTGSVFESGVLQEDGVIKPLDRTQMVVVLDALKTFMTTSDIVKAGGVLEYSIREKQNISRVLADQQSLAEQTTEA